jgi:hypothetical protein
MGTWVLGMKCKNSICSIIRVPVSVGRFVSGWRAFASVSLCKHMYALSCLQYINNGCVGHWHTTSRSCLEQQHTFSHNEGHGPYNQKHKLAAPELHSSQYQTALQRNIKPSQLEHLCSWRVEKHALLRCILEQYLQRSWNFMSDCTCKVCKINLVDSRSLNQVTLDVTKLVQRISCENKCPERGPILGHTTPLDTTNLLRYITKKSAQANESLLSLARDVVSSVRPSVRPRPALGRRLERSGRQAEVVRL